MTDEIKTEAECRKIIHHTGKAMIDKKRTEKDIQSNDTLSLLRTFPLFFKFIIFTITLKSNQTFAIPPQSNCLMKKYWMNALHFFILGLTPFPSLYHGVYICYPFIPSFKQDYETNFVMPWLAIMQTEIPQIALRIPDFMIAVTALVLVKARHSGAKSKIFPTLKLWFAKP